MEVTRVTRVAPVAAGLAVVLAADLAEAQDSERLARQVR